MEHKTEYTIDRKTWLRGEGWQNSFLLRKDGKYCCLGQICLQEGVSKENLLGLASPVTLLNTYQINTWLTEDTGLMSVAMGINDNDETTDEEKEKTLIELFAKHEVTLTFIN